MLEIFLTILVVTFCVPVVLSDCPRRKKIRVGTSYPCAAWVAPGNSPKEKNGPRPGKFPGAKNEIEKIGKQSGENGGKSGFH
jgi:hypothetical protein